MTKQMEFKETLKPFEKIEQHIDFDKEGNYQIYFEFKEGYGAKKLISFLEGR